MAEGEKMDEKIFQEALQKHKEIRKRLEEYKKHKNDPYTYYPGEIKEMREFLGHALEDIEFLLNTIDRILPETFKKLFLK